MNCSTRVTQMSSKKAISLNFQFTSMKAMFFVLFNQLSESKRVTMLRNHNNNLLKFSSMGPKIRFGEECLYKAIQSEIILQTKLNHLTDLDKRFPFQYGSDEEQQWHPFFQQLILSWTYAFFCRDVSMVTGFHSPIIISK